MWLSVWCISKVTQAGKCKTTVLGLWTKIQRAPRAPHSQSETPSQKSSPVACAHTCYTVTMPPSHPALIKNTITRTVRF